MTVTPLLVPGFLSILVVLVILPKTLTTFVFNAITLGFQLYTNSFFNTIHGSIKLIFLCSQHFLGMLEISV